MDDFFSFAAIAVLLILLASLGGCGGGSSPAPYVEPSTPHKSIGPQLRPCETTGPTAPPCTAS